MNTRSLLGAIMSHFNLVLSVKRAKQGHCESNHWSNMALVTKDTSASKEASFWIPFGRLPFNGYLWRPRNSGRKRERERSTNVWIGVSRNLRLVGGETPKFASPPQTTCQPFVNYVAHLRTIFQTVHLNLTEEEAGLFYCWGFFCVCVSFFIVFLRSFDSFGWPASS